MSRRRYKRYYRRMRTTQERRLSFACEAQYVRPARNFRNLPNAWDDIHVHGDTSWKGLRKKQYRSEKRGKKNELVISSGSYSYLLGYNLEEYFKDNDIPYRIEEVRQTYTYRREITKYVEKYKKPKHQYHWKWVATETGRVLQRIVGKQIGYESVGEWIGTGEYKTCTGSTVTDYKIIWWSDKDIGISHILNRIHYY